MSPGSRPRPSLSGAVIVRGHDLTEGVAGVSAPAFVERTNRRSNSAIWKSVAGVSAPAFVERRSTVFNRPLIVNDVSPGSRPRPSLSVQQAALDTAVGRVIVSPGSRPRPSLSAE